MANSITNFITLISAIIGWILFFYLVIHIYRSRHQEIKLIKSILEDVYQIKKDLGLINKINLDNKK